MTGGRKSTSEQANARLLDQWTGEEAADGGIIGGWPGADSGLMNRKKSVLFATPLSRLSIGCSITALIATAGSNHAGRHADVWSNADSWLAKPSQAV